MMRSLENWVGLELQERVEATDSLMLTKQQTDRLTDWLTN